jgi:hypothetical protein
LNIFCVIGHPNWKVVLCKSKVKEQQRKHKKRMNNSHIFLLFSLIWVI